jgi:hypothetical protein
MLRHDIDGILVWLTEEDKRNGQPALVLDTDESEKDKYCVYHLTKESHKLVPHGGLTLQQALLIFVTELLADDKR